MTGQPDYAAIPATNSSIRLYLDQAVYGTQILDYTVDSISSSRAQWWLPEPKDKKQIQYLSTVYLHRKGDFILPVTVEISSTTARVSASAGTAAQAIRIAGQNSPTPATPK